MVFTTEGFLEVAIEFVGCEPTTTEFRSEALSYQAMSSTCSQNQLCTASQISSLCSVLFHVLFWSLPSSVATFAVTEVLWRRGVVVITTAQLHSRKPELRFCAGSNPTRGVSEIRECEDL